MSTNDMNTEQAQQVVFEQVYLPAFKKASADLGIEYTDEQSLVNALESVSLIKGAEAHKNASASNESVSALRDLLGVEQPADTSKQAAEAQAVQDVASSDQVRDAMSVLLAS